MNRNHAANQGTVSDLSCADIHEIEMRARELRAEYFAMLMGSLFRALFSRKEKPTGRRTVTSLQLRTH